MARQVKVEAAGHHPYEEEVDEMWKWIKISFIVAIPVCILSSIKDIVGEHHYRKEGELPDYMSIRSKPFPWECENCSYFDFSCNFRYSSVSIVLPFF